MYATLSIESLCEDDVAGSYDDQHEKVMVQCSLRNNYVCQKKGYSSGQ